MDADAELGDVVNGGEEPVGGNEDASNKVEGCRLTSSSHQS